jgi:ubiquinone/menaquinone biosynthesis C-methylase UbiE
VGCGTARDIEYVIEHLKACKTQLYLLDLSPALLEMARARIAAHGLQDQVGQCTFLS